MDGRALTTIGYEGASMEGFLRTLTAAGVEVLVDVRAVASSRRAGFSKNSLAANLAGVGIDYLQLSALGTPPDGRAAARAGRFDDLRRIYGAHLHTSEAQDQLAGLIEVVRGGRSACLLCFEADARHCHRSMVADLVAAALAIHIEHITVERQEQ